MRSCAVIDFYTLIICYIIQWKHHNNMVFDDIDVDSNVKFYYSKVCTNNPDSTLCMGKIDIIMI